MAASQQQRVSTLCQCGRLLDWSLLSTVHKDYRNALVTCEVCGSSTAVKAGEAYAEASRIQSPKGKRKEKEGVSSGDASDRYLYGRLQMIRLGSKFVYNPHQGSEMEAPKYSGTLFVLGKEWLVPEERRAACGVCANKFDMFRWKYNCRCCGEVVCDNCSKTTKTVVGYDAPQRVCKSCADSGAAESQEQWRQAFLSIQSGTLFLRSGPVLDEQARGCFSLSQMTSVDHVSDVTLKAETGVPPPNGLQDFCFKIVFTNNGEVDARYFSAKTQELANTWITALKEGAKEKGELSSKQKKLNADFLSACSKTDGKKVKELLKEGADPTYVKDLKSGTTALMHCAKSTKPDATLCTTLILQAGTNPNVQDSTGKTALHYSITTLPHLPPSDDTVTDMLLRFGADLSVEDAVGQTPWESGNCRNNNIATAKLSRYENSVVLTSVELRKILERGGSVNWKDGQGNSLLHLTCEKRVYDALKFLLENRANVNARNLFGQAPIHLATISKFDEGIKLLLEHKASINIQDNKGYTPLHNAIIFNVPSVVEILLNREANPDIRTFPQSGSMTALHLAACLGYKECANKLLEKGCIPNLEDEMGQTPHTIAKRFDTDILPMLKKFTDLHKIFLWCREPARRPDIEQIIENDKTLDVNWTNGEKMSMLHVATKSQNLPVVELLLAHRANFDAADAYGNTPIDMANGTEKTLLVPSAKNEKIHQRFLQYRRIFALNDFILRGSLPDVKRLLKDSPTEYNLHVHNGMAPLHIAAEHGYVAICKRLMKGGARIDFPTTDGKTAVHIAAQFGNVDCLNMLLTHAAGKASVNLGDANGNTPLLLCVKKSPDTLVAICEILLANGAEVEQKNRDGENAIDVAKCDKTSAGNKFELALTRHRNGLSVIEAARRGDSKHIATIFELESDAKPSADFQDLYGKTALHYACASQEGESCVSILLRNGARVEIRDNEQKTPLDIIRARMHTERTQRLLTQYAAGIQVSTCAVSGQKQRMQQLLTKFNIDVDFCDQIEMKTPLHWACISGSQTCVEYLLNQGAIVDIKDKNSETPLFLAVRNGHKAIIEILLDRGANPEICNAKGKRLVQCICNNSEAQDQLRRARELFAIMNLLNINIGPHEEEDVKKTLEELFERLEYEQNTLAPEIESLLKKHINGRIFVEEFAEKGDLARLRESYTQLPHIINYRSNGDTALHRAVKRGYSDMVEDLLEQGALVSIKDNNKKSAVDTAKESIEKGENTKKMTKILELLHKYGCGPDVIDLCQDGKDEQLDELLTNNIAVGFNPDYRFRGDFTGLHVAASHGHLKCVEVLFKHGASPDKQDADGFTPLHYAARWGKEDVVKKLLEVGVDIEQRNDQGLTPLMMAAIGEHNRCVQLLTAHGAIVNVQNNNRRTPLMLATLSGFTECVQLLLEKSADPNILDASKNTALHYATIHGHVEIIKLLLANKAEPNLENRMNHSPAIVATAKGNTTLLGLLLSSKATDPNFGSKINPLFVSIHNRNIECMKLLLQNNADPNKKFDGITPLHRAVLLGESQIISLLLSYDANPLIDGQFKIGDNFFKLNVIELATVANLSGQSPVSLQQLRCKAAANAIRESINKGEITALKQLLEEYDDADVISYQDRNGQTPLHWACEKDYVSCVKSLIIYYPSLTVQDKNGNTPLALARKTGNDEIIQELQHYENAIKLLKTASDGNEAELKNIIEKGNVDLEFSKPDKNTVLHLCAAYGYLNCLKLVLVKAGHLAGFPNDDGLLPIHLAAERGHLSCVQELLPVTKPGGKVLSDKLWELAVGNSQREVIVWLQSDLCSNKDLPNNLFPSPIEVEYHQGDLVSFLTVNEDVTFYELERSIYNKVKRWMYIEQRITQGRTQIRDDSDLRKAINTAKDTANKEKNSKVVVVFHLTQNLENRPVADKPTAAGNTQKIISRLRSNSKTPSDASAKETAAPSVTVDQFKQLKEKLIGEFNPFQKELEKELKKISAQMKYARQQNSDIYDEIQGIKANDREFVAN